MNRDRYTGLLVRSRSGHDTGEIYLVVAEDDRFASICDGRLRTVDKPKRKNKKHLALLTEGYDNNAFRDKQPDDISVRKLIREYKKVLRITKEEDNV